MTDVILHSEGKLYDPKHLRPFDLALALQGHPLATGNGCEVSHIFLSDQQNYLTVRNWLRYLECGYWETRSLPIQDKDGTGDHLYLAPLAVKAGRALHIGDVIETCPWYGHGKYWEREHIQKPSDAAMLVEEVGYARYGKLWRFAS